MDIHKRLRKFRKDLDLSYQAIAEACGVKWQTVQQWCKDEADGGTDPKLANLEPLANIDFYRQRRTAVPERQESTDPAEEALNEIARYLLMAVRVITSRRH
jgi:transcriptional regulator with XRE-family HTH domain